MKRTRPLHIALIAGFLLSCSDGKGGRADEDGDGGAQLGEDGEGGIRRDGAADSRSGEAGAGNGATGRGGQGGEACVCDDLTPVCLEDTGECVECSDEVRGACRGATPLCADHRCVACLTDTDCVEPRAPVCDEGACVRCTDDAQCGDGRICDTASGACGECTADKREACTSGGAATVCDVLSRECTAFAPGSAGACASCVSDDHCAPGHACVEQSFDGKVVGTYCLPVQVSGCARPFTASLADTRTIEGRSVSVCGPAQTTCPALAGSTGYGAACGVDASGKLVASGAVRGDDGLCGMRGIDDAVCVKSVFGGAYRCTLPCDVAGSDDENLCPNTFPNVPGQSPSCVEAPHFPSASPVTSFVCGI
jgi:hypothetical protein